MNFEPHDVRLCFHYHSWEDIRRNPYIQFYSGSENKNDFERAYYPLAYKTEICQNLLTCIGRFFPRAHQFSELRYVDPETYHHDHSFLFCPARNRDALSLSEHSNIVPLSGSASTG